MSDTPHVAVTGAAGFIGSRVVGDLARAHPDWTLTALDNFYLGEVREVEGVPVEHVDIRHREELAEALADADAVVHLAAISGVDDCEQHPDRAYEVNVAGTANVAYCCRQTGAALAFPFSMAVIGDPPGFPITADTRRDPLNWYGETKVLGERTIETMADGAFPAHLFMISNLYGEHTVGDRTVSKNTVINFFVERALAGKPLTVYEPGSQARNFIHVRDVSAAFVASVEQLLADRTAGETGARAFEVASDEDPSVLAVAEMVQRVANEKRDIDVDVEIVENPRSGETLVDEFGVDTSTIEQELDWRPERSVEASIRELLSPADHEM
ncbi:NAD-dependent epimerase/dehydratase family protein [Halosegnis sp.]|uniref:NAD-dependent epimerase/dehydratase family protein n=1 Tax=Halosegnis sp. TaxID=2864959 RepID=UPI0035D40013